MSEDTEKVVSEETNKEENRSQLGPTTTRGGLGTIHRNRLQFHSKAMVTRAYMLIHYEKYLKFRIAFFGVHCTNAIFSPIITFCKAKRINLRSNITNGHKSLTKWARIGTKTNNFIALQKWIHRKCTKVKSNCYRSLAKLGNK